MALASAGLRTERFYFSDRDDVETSLFSEVMQIQSAVTELQNQLAHVCISKKERREGECSADY